MAIVSGLAPETEETPRAAGWFPGRRSDTSGWRTRFEETGLAMHDAADDFLREFGGLQVGAHGSGITCAREAFHLDPLLVWNSEEDRFAEWGEEIGRALFPVGELDQGRFFLGIDEQAELYVVETWVASFGRLPAAMDNLVLGVMPTPVA
ncbi:SUKH-3 domain-containing protein [Streptomyces sp. NPDC005485]|uniref:SUKH-3 domain-containing protein n=1 Tax=Streptomyces sp. NPDC005485 TaxID=3155591 RepID=UPI0033BFB7B0